MSRARFDFPDCIITGCLFYDTADERHIVADLHRLGDCYIINGNYSGRTDWVDGPPPPDHHYNKVVSVDNGAYFERRGMIVFTTRVAVFNRAAEDYIAENIRLSQPSA